MIPHSLGIMNLSVIAVIMIMTVKTIIIMVTITPPPQKYGKKYSVNTKHMSI